VSAPALWITDWWTSGPARERSDAVRTDVGNANGGLTLAGVVGTDLEDTFDNRLVCGTGVFDVPSFLRAVRDLGWQAPWGVEHMSVEYRRLPVDTAQAQATDAALACLAAAGAAQASAA
jgi:sugar phosphate isomerase/epimerase